MLPVASQMQTTLAGQFGGLHNVELYKGDSIEELLSRGVFDRVYTAVADAHVGAAVSSWVHKRGTHGKLAVLLCEHYHPLEDGDTTILTRRGSCFLSGNGGGRQFVSVTGPQHQ